MSFLSDAKEEKNDVAHKSTLDLHSFSARAGGYGKSPVQAVCGAIASLATV